MTWRMCSGAVVDGIDKGMLDDLERVDKMHDLVQEGIEVQKEGRRNYSLADTAAEPADGDRAMCSLILRRSHTLCAWPVVSLTLEFTTRRKFPT